MEASGKKGPEMFKYGDRVYHTVEKLGGTVKHEAILVEFDTAILVEFDTGVMFYADPANLIVGCRCGVNRLAHKSKDCGPINS